jgi:hypothetical protein
MQLRSAFLTMAMAAGLLSGACSSGTNDPSGTGGSSGQAGAAGGSTTGAGGACPNASACGGSVVGTWTVSSSCLTLSSTNLDIGPAGLDPLMCTNVKLRGSMNVSGTWTAHADGTYTDNTTTSGTTTVDLPAGCLNLSGTKVSCDGIAGPFTGMGFSEVTCVPASGGGCTCTGTIQHAGSLGLLSVDAQTAGGYTTSGSTLTTDSVPEAKYSYCVSGNTLTMMPQSTNPTQSGTVVLTKSSTSGAAGSGGTTGAAGAPGNGGSAGPAGEAGRGGATSGTAGTGVAGRGGSTGAAGAAGRGGSSSGVAGSTGEAGAGGGSTGRADGPCDLYAAAGTPCAAAYSMVRALSKTYTGFLYQVRSGSSAMNTGSGGTVKDIPMLPDGFADTATQDAFCSGTTCTVSLLYDHSGNGNTLSVAKKGLSAGGTYSASDDFESAANKGMMTIKGHKVYSLYMNAREGYRIMKVGNKMPVGSASQGIYELADGTHVGTACCWDFGNVTTNPQTYADMNTLFFGVAYWGKGAGSGPWMMADFEAGVWSGGSKVGDPGWGALDDNQNRVNPSNPSLKVPFAFGALKTSSNEWTLKGADAQTATSPTMSYRGAMPKKISNVGAIVLGVGGDNSNNSWGTFYEGAIVAGYPTDAAELAVFNNIKAVGYTK